MCLVFTFLFCYFYIKLIEALINVARTARKVRGSIDYGKNKYKAYHVVDVNEYRFAGHN